MRIANCLFLALVFTASAFGEPPVYHTPMPEGGMDLIQPGYTLRTPGRGWILNSTIEPGSGAIRGFEHLGGFFFTRGPERSATGVILVFQVHWSPDLTALPTPINYLEKYDSFGGALPQNADNVSITPTTVNGALCARSRSKTTRQKQSGPAPDTELLVRQICVHPEFPGLAVEVRYQLYEASSAADADVIAVMDSLKFAPLPYRLSEIRPGCTVGAMAEADGALWVLCKSFGGNPDERGQVLRIDPARNAVSAAVQVGRSPTEVVAAGGYLWVGNLFDDTVSRIDPKTNSVTATVGLSGGPIELLSAGGFVWVHPSNGTQAPQSYVRIDPATARIDKGFRADGYLYAVAAGRWIILSGSKDWLRVDGATGEVLGKIKLEGMPLHYDGRYLWFKQYDITEIKILKRDLDDPNKPAEEVRRVRGEVSDFAFWNGEFCVLNENAVRCGPLDGEQTREVPIEPYMPARLRVFAGSLWVDDWAGGSLLRIDPK